VTLRRAFSDALVKIAAEDDRVIFLTGDLGFQVFDEFCTRFPGRYVNVGVAEAQLVDCAAGLALEGWRPIVYSIASFITGRAFEQIRVMASYHNLPMVVVGAGGGYTYGSSGVTHHAKEDLGLMSLLPNFAVVAPGDPGEVHALMPQLVNRKGPSYIRIGRFGEPAYTAPEPAQLGKARFLRSGSRVLMVSTGGQAVQALEAWDQLEKEGKAPTALQMHTIKPLDEEALDRHCDGIRAVLVVEEHSPIAGLGAAISTWSAKRQNPIRVMRLGPGDDLALGNAHQHELRQRLRYDTAHIVAACKALW
jgi:transketolase